MEYTLILIHYNQNERLVKCIDYWNKLTIPPKEIIVVDDGSKIVPNNCISLKHTGNISSMRNMAIELCKTEAFILSDDSIFPYNIEPLIKYSSPKRMMTGIWVYLDSLSFPEISVSKINVKTNDWWCPHPAMFFKSTFPYYNEIYSGWGAEDNDIQFRMLLSGIEIYFNSEIKWVHWNHNKIGDAYDPKKIEKNRQYLQILVPVYQQRGLWRIEKNKEGKREFLSI